MQDKHADAISALQTQHTKLLDEEKLRVTNLEKLLSDATARLGTFEDLRRSGLFRHLFSKIASLSFRTGPTFHDISFVSSLDHF